jgi:hypothetical protein
MKQKVSKLEYRCKVLFLSALYMEKYVDYCETKSVTYSFLINCIFVVPEYEFDMKVSSKS